MGKLGPVLANIAKQWPDSGRKSRSTFREMSSRRPPNVQIWKRSANFGPCLTDVSAGFCCQPPGTLHVCNLLGGRTSHTLCPAASPAGFTPATVFRAVVRHSRRSRRLWCMQGLRTSSHTRQALGVCICTVLVCAHVRRAPQAEEGGIMAKCHGSCGGLWFQASIAARRPYERRQSGAVAAARQLAQGWGASAGIPSTGNWRGPQAVAGWCGT